jgi:predicted amidophosphoribosyltransferase
VPSSRRRARHRGYDHALALARNAAAGLVAVGAPAAALGLLRLASVGRQVGLGRSARLANRSGQMTLHRSRAGDQLAGTLRGTRIVVVDDIATTGATLDEAVRVLRRAGLEPCGAAVVARVEGLPAVSGPWPSG